MVSDDNNKKQYLKPLMWVIGIIIIILLLFTMSKFKTKRKATAIIKETPYTYCRGIIIDNHDFDESVESEEPTTHIEIELAGDQGIVMERITMDKYDTMPIGTDVIVIIDRSKHYQQQQIIEVFESESKLNDYIQTEESKGRNISELKTFNIEHYDT